MAGGRNENQIISEDKKKKKKNQINQMYTLRPPSKLDDQVSFYLLMYMLVIHVLI